MNLQPNAAGELLKEFQTRLATTGPSGFSLKALCSSATPADTSALQLIAYATWLNTCGLAAHTFGEFTLVSPLQGFAPFLKSDVSFYLQAEALYCKNLQQWAGRVKNLPLPGLTPIENPVSAVKTSDGKTHFCHKLEAVGNLVRLQGVLIPHFNPELLRLQIGDEHPLAAVLSPYNTAKDITFPVQELIGIERENPNIFRLSLKHPLAKLAEALIQQTIL